MFLVTEADAAAIRAIFDEHGELSAAVELRRRFPGIIDNENAQACARVHRLVDAAARADAQGDTATAQRAVRSGGPRQS
jgi:hypothetical protein